MKGYMYKLLVVSIVSLIAVSAVQADTVSFVEGPANTFYPGGYFGTHDNQILGYGGWETANVGARNTFMVGTGNPGGVRRPIVRFDGLSAMAGKTVTAAKIVLRKASVSAGTNNSTDVDMYAITDANAGWIEGNGIFVPAAPGESAWNYHDEPNGWASGGPFANSDMGATPLASLTMGDEDSVNTVYEFTLPTSLVQQWIDGINAGVIIKIRDEVNVGANSQMYTSEFGALADAPVRPTLVIDYVPEPATIGLLSLGGLAMLRRKRRA